MMMEKIHKYKQSKVSQMRNYCRNAANTASLRVSPERVTLNPSKDASMVLTKKSSQNSKEYHQNQQITKRIARIKTLQNKTFQKGKEIKQKEKCMNSRSADPSHINFENNIIKMYALIMKLIVEGKQKKILLEILLKVLGSNQKKKKVVFLVVWVLNWIKYVFELFHKKIKFMLKV